MSDLFLRSLHLVNFKNYPEASLDLSDKINVFVGPNGAGKTNLLDAVYYLSMTKSYFNSIDVQNIRYDEGFYLIEGEYQRGEEKERIHLGLKKGHKKVLKRNKKEYERLSEHIGRYPLVMISPYDRDLIMEGSEIRRRFMDGVISQSDRLYLDDLLQYNKALAQRNALLKYFAANRTFDPTQLEIYDEVLCERGDRIHEARRKFMQEMEPILLSYYAKIAGDEEPLSIRYRSTVEGSSMRNVLRENLDKDRVLQFTGQGIHKDDLKFLLFDHPLKKTGSQGQQKSFLIALKLAQFDFMKSQTGTKPLLLLDDIFDKLDEHRVRALVELVNEHHFGQIFISDTHPERTAALTRQINEETRIFDVQKGGTVREAI
ncbi:MAG: DNA replication/repair protein RecF [Bacteroidota bacterium]|nr:DNA replication/repair protein RecF [Bacteroidota bacterium]